MLKHVGRHGDRKVAIVFREIPGEDHMCLVIYPEVMPTHMHDSIMKVLESASGQAESVLANALHRNLLPDGRPILEALHREGMLKKVATNQVVVTPTPTSSVKLDELNRLVKEMEMGEDAVRRMKEIDASAGIVDPAVKREAEQRFKREQLERETAARNQGQPMIPANATQALDDNTLATNMLAQAKKMEAEAKGLINEAARMKKEAEKIWPRVNLSQDTTSTPDNKARKKTKQSANIKDAVQ